MRLGVDGFKIKGIIYLTSSPTPQCRLGCLLICGKCRAAFRRVACCASALSSHAAPWGHFASLVRSASPARLPSASLRRISRQSRDCLRVRVLHSCTPSSRRQPCFPAFPAVAQGVAFVYGCARRATVASALTANVIRHGICGGLLRAAMRRIAIQPHLHKPYAIR